MSVTAHRTPGDDVAPTVAFDVVHAVPGRVRCRVDRLRSDSAYARRLTALGRREGALSVSPAAASLVLRHPPEASLAEARARVDELLELADHEPVDPPPAAPRSALQGRWPRLVLPAVMAAIAGLGGIAGMAVPTPVGAIAILAASLPIARRATHALRVERRLNIDVLDMTAITLTTLRGSLMAPAFMISLVEIGEAIRERTARASRRELLDLLDSIAQVVWVERHGERRQVPTDEIRRGEVVVLYPGDRIPVDGRIVAGRGLIDEHQLTGEAMPALRAEGEVVYASTLVREGHLHIGVEQIGAETRAGRIVALMREAPVHDTRIEDYAAKLADRIVLPALLLAGGVLLATRSPNRAAAILITDFATGIRVSVPTTVLAAMTRAAQRGVLIRSGHALEQLASVDAVVFDKTGTVTRGEPTITGVQTAHEGVDPLEVLALALTAEQRLNHPVAEAVVRYAHQHKVKPDRRSGWHYDIGLGVRATIDGRTVLVGSDRLMNREGIDTQVLDARRGADAESLIYVAREGELLGGMAYADPVRVESHDVLRALRDAHGMETHLLTGDRPQTAAAVAEQLGIPSANVHARLFPEEKAAVVRELRDRGRCVAFVGDGINDLPALAYADVSVSFGGATDVARETADVVLMNDDLRGLPIAFGIARQALRLIHQNIGIVAGVNVSAMSVATTVGLGPVAAAVIHNGSTVVAALNGLRPLLDGEPQRNPTRPTALKIPPRAADEKEVTDG